MSIANEVKSQNKNIWEGEVDEIVIESIMYDTSRKSFRK